MLLGSVAGGGYGFMKLTQEGLLPNKNVVDSGDKGSGSSSISTDHSFPEQQNSEEGVNSFNSGPSTGDRAQTKEEGERKEIQDKVETQVKEVDLKNDSLRSSRLASLQEDNWREGDTGL
ncbi:hypothetical protein [Mycoplasma suis]|uniref:hypothetical protein n=1 Tax=Mycoplasma suis TaxID=57372 RepID=UPI0011D111BE|nr:hypothetical protein [Mycoplasma suis]